MTSMDKAYALFGQWLEQGPKPGEPVPTFRELCRELRVSPVDLDEVVFRETGMHGDEIIVVYFGNGDKIH